MRRWHGWLCCCCCCCWFCHRTRTRTKIQMQMQMQKQIQRRYDLIVLVVGWASGPGHDKQIPVRWIERADSLGRGSDCLFLMVMQESQLRMLPWATKTGRQQLLDQKPKKRWKFLSPILFFSPTFRLPWRETVHEPVQEEGTVQEVSKFRGSATVANVSSRTKWNGYGIGSWGNQCGIFIHTIRITL